MTLAAMTWEARGRLVSVHTCATRKGESRKPGKGLRAQGLAGGLLDASANRVERAVVPNASLTSKRELPARPQHPFRNHVEQFSILGDRARARGRRAPWIVGREGEDLLAGAVYEEVNLGELE